MIATRRVEGRASNRVPCDVCCRFHRGPRCKPEDQRTVRVCTTFPGPVYRAMVDAVPWGERSAWVAGLVARELEGK